MGKLAECLDKCLDLYPGYVFTWNFEGQLHTFFFGIRSLQNVCQTFDFISLGHLAWYGFGGMQTQGFFYSWPPKLHVPLKKCMPDPYLDLQNDWPGKAGTASMPPFHWTIPGHMPSKNGMVLCCGGHYLQDTLSPWWDAKGPHPYISGSVNVEFWIWKPL